MPIETQELGRRLRVAREVCGLTHEEVAAHLGASQPAVARMERGTRAITSLEFERLARLYARDMKAFFEDEFRADDALLVPFRGDPQRTDTMEAVRRVAEFGREITDLERRLGVERRSAHLSRSAGLARADPPRGHFLALSLEAYRRVAISRRKLFELGEMVDVSREEIEDMLEQLGLDSGDQEGASLPAGGG